MKLDEGKHDLASLSLNFRYRKLDNIFVPTRGWNFNIETRVYTEMLGSDYDFYKITAKASKYFPLYETRAGTVHTLQAKISAGYMNEYNDTDNIPTFARFYSGGVNSIRGWQSREIGPRIGEEPIGGYFRACATLEYYVPLYQDTLYFATFFDAGGVWNTAGDFDSDGMRYGTGIGFYIKVPFSQMPIRFYLAEALNDKEREDTQFVQFSFGFLF